MSAGFSKSQLLARASASWLLTGASERSAATWYTVVREKRFDGALAIGKRFAGWAVALRDGMECNIWQLPLLQNLGAGAGLLPEIALELSQIPGAGSFDWLLASFSRSWIVEEIRTGS